MSCTEAVAAAAEEPGLEVDDAAGFVAGLEAASFGKEDADAEADPGVREVLDAFGACFGFGFGTGVHCSSSRSTRRSCCRSAVNFLLPSTRPPPLAVAASLGLRLFGILRNTRRGAGFFPSFAVSVAVLSCTTKSLKILRMQSLSADGAASGLLPGDACAAAAVGESMMEPYWSSDQSSPLRSILSALACGWTFSSRRPMGARILPRKGTKRHHSTLVRRVAVASSHPRSCNNSSSYVTEEANRMTWHCVIIILLQERWRDLARRHRRRRRHRRHLRHLLLRFRIHAYQLPARADARHTYFPGAVAHQATATAAAWPPDSLAARSITFQFGKSVKHCGPSLCVNVISRTICL